MKLSSLFKNSSQNSSSTTTTTPWPWSLPTCGKPKTLSFRLEKNQHNIYNSTFHLDDINDTTSCSFDDFFSEIDETSSSSTTTINGQDCIEKVIKGLRLEKERLFFEPEETSSILDFQENKNISITSSNININVVDEGNIISFVPMGLDSNDPFVDFRKSMEEMVEAYEIKDWENLEELLTCYLKVNCKSNHGYIVGAFVDLLVNLATFSDNNNNVGVDIGAGVGAGVDESTIIMTTIDEEQQCLSSSTTTTTTTNHSFTSPLSFCSSSCSTSSSITSTSACLSLLLEEDEVIQTKKH